MRRMGLNSIRALTSLIGNRVVSLTKAVDGSVPVFRRLRRVDQCDRHTRGSWDHNKITVEDTRMDWAKVPAYTVLAFCRLPDRIDPYEASQRPFEIGESRVIHTILHMRI
jgi:hypothetical protein